MKRSSKKPSSTSKNSSRSVKWFGIRITYIALPVAMLGLIVGAFLIKQSLASSPKLYVLAAHDVPSTSTEQGFTSFGDSTDPVGGGEIAPSHCLPRPACLDAKPRCLIAEPAGGWCDLSPTPTITLPPHGCFYNRQCITISCPSGVTADECYACKKALVCPSEEPHPSITCTPRPTCAVGQACPLFGDEEGIHWCPLTHISSSPIEGGDNATSQATTKDIGKWWNTFFRTFFH